MKKLALLLIVFLMISGCGSGPDKKEADREVPQKELDEITLLEREIEAIDSEIVRLIKTTGINSEGSPVLSDQSEMQSNGDKSSPETDAYAKVSQLRYERGVLIKKLSAQKESKQER